MLEKFLNTQFLNNSVSAYLVSLLLFVLGLLAVKILKQVVLHQIKKWAQKTKTTLDDFIIHLIERAIIPLSYYGAFLLAIRNLDLGTTMGKIINIASITLVTYFGISSIILITTYLIERYWLKKESDVSRTQNIKIIIPILKVIIWGIGITFLLDNLGFKVSTVIAGLGIGGVAVAMASQAILGDLFSYFTILFDRPFEIGDFIITGDYLGNIEHIGIKTTRIRSLGGEQIVFSNSDLTGSRLRNYKRMEKRRVVFRIGVTYKTALKQLKEIPEIIKHIIGRMDRVKFDRAHFCSYGDFNLVFEVVYYILSSDFNKHMDIQQEIFYSIKEEFEKRDIEFAYPTQTLYLTKTQ